MKRGTNWLEWTVLAASAALVAGTAGVLAWQVATAKEGPPVVGVTVGPPRALDGGWAVPVQARNEGGETAENVAVEVQLGEGSDAPRGEVHWPFLPVGSERSGWVTFAEPPGPGRQPQARVLGFGRP